jgi:hypothetical protein
MRAFTESVRKALADENWHAALTVALTLPDICGKVPASGQASSTRYIAWMRKYLMPRYSRIGVSYSIPGMPRPPAITAENFYALRCAYLHEGRDEITEQRIRQLLNKFRFVAPDPLRGMSEHCNIVDSHGTVSLVLRVDTFCSEICEGVETWLKDISSDDAAQKRLDSLLEVYPPFTL